MDEKRQPEHVDVVDESSAGSESALSEDNYRGLDFKTIAVYLSVNLITFSQLLNLVGCGAYARDIAAEIGGLSNASWLTSAIAIMTCILSPPVSQAADYWGRKWFVVVLTFCGCIGCIIVSRATSMGMAIAGEVVAGLAFGSQPLLYAVSSEILPRRYRPAAQAGINIAVALGGIFALLVGSVLTKSHPNGFRTFWYITAAIQAVAATICAVLYNPPPRPESAFSTKQKLQNLDWVGYALLASGITLFTMGLSWAENPYAWKDKHVLAPFLIGIGLLCALAWHQIMMKSDGIFHHDLFKKDRNFSIGLLCIFVEGMVFFAANLYYSFETSVLYETDPIKTSARFSITFITSIIACMAIGYYSSKSKKLRIPTVIAYLLFLLFNILMATAKLSSGTALWAYPIALGIGLGVCLTCIVTAAQLSAPPTLIAISSGLLISIRSLGGSVATAIYTAIFNSQISTKLPDNIAAAVLPLGLNPHVLPEFIEALSANNQTALRIIPGVSPQIIKAGAHGLLEAYLVSFRYVWVTAGAFSVVAAIASMFMVNATSELNMHVDAPLVEKAPK